jgi:hypothetical protein
LPGHKHLLLSEIKAAEVEAGVEVEEEPMFAFGIDCLRFEFL